MGMNMAADCQHPKIESGIPLPRSRGNWAFVLEMNVNDSFFIPGGDSGQLGSRLTHITKKHGWTFSIRSVVKDGVAGSRVWRTS